MEAVFPIVIALDSFKLSGRLHYVQFADCVFKPPITHPHSIKQNFETSLSPESDERVLDALNSRR